MRREKPHFEIRKSFSPNRSTTCISLPKACCDYMELLVGQAVGIWQKRGPATIELKDGDIVIRKIQEEAA